MASEQLTDVEKQKLLEYTKWLKRRRLLELGLPSLLVVDAYVIDKLDLGSPPKMFSREECAQARESEWPTAWEDHLKKCIVCSCIEHCMPILEEQHAEFMRAKKLTKPSLKERVRKWLRKVGIK